MTKQEILTIPDIANILTTEYIIDNKSLKELCAKYNCSSATLSRVFKILDIKKDHELQSANVRRNKEAQYQFNPADIQSYYDVHTVEDTAKYFVRFGVEVFDVDKNLSEMEIAKETIKKLREFIKSLGQPLTFTEAGIDDRYFNEIVENIWFLEKNADEDIVVSKYNFASGGNSEEQVNLSALGIESADSVVTLNDKYVMIEEDEGRYSLVILEEARKVSVKKYRKLGELVDIFVDPDLSSRIVMTYLDEESYYFYSVNEKGHYEFIGKTEEAERVKGLVYKIDKESNEFEKIEIRRNNNGTQDIES